jgi:DNA-binding response OmpR family regulator
LDRVWNTTYTGQDRAVDYAIHRLRRKLHAAGDLIETVHGVGYRLRDDR